MKLLRYCQPKIYLIEGAILSGIEMGNLFLKLKFPKRLDTLENTI
jgi:hypothetical protein